MAERVRLGLARSFQITSILPGFSALENVALAVQARSGSSFRFFGDAAAEPALNEPAAEYLGLVGLGLARPGRAHAPAGELSHGEKRQLELAVALATEPKLLLLDEPLAGTGHEDAARLIDVLRRLKGRYAIVLIEHDMDAVFALADRISVLVYGRVIATRLARRTCAPTPRCAPPISARRRPDAGRARASRPPTAPPRCCSTSRSTSAPARS